MIRLTAIIFAHLLGHRVRRVHVYDRVRVVCLASGVALLNLGGQLEAVAGDETMSVPIADYALLNLPRDRTARSRGPRRAAFLEVLGGFAPVPAARRRVGSMMLDQRRGQA